LIAGSSFGEVFPRLAPRAPRLAPRASRPALRARAGDDRRGSREPACDGRRAWRQMQFLLKYSGAASVNKGSAFALTSATLLHLPHDAVMRIVASCPVVLERLWQNFGQLLFLAHPQHFANPHAAPPSFLHARLKHGAKGSRVRRRHSMLLLKGGAAETATGRAPGRGEPPGSPVSALGFVAADPRGALAFSEDAEVPPCPTHARMHACGSAGGRRVTGRGWLGALQTAAGVCAQLLVFVPRADIIDRRSLEMGRGGLGGFSAGAGGAARGSAEFARGSVDFGRRTSMEGARRSLQIPRGPPLRATPDVAAASASARRSIGGGSPFLRHPSMELARGPGPPGRHRLSLEAARTPGAAPGAPAPGALFETPTQLHRRDLTDVRPRSAAPPRALPPALPPAAASPEIDSTPSALSGAAPRGAARAARRSGARALRARPRGAGRGDAARGDAARGE